ncbi:MAG: heptosyltransferase family protein [uncultured bacterium]|nr:MAG: heptosyltransferase family protein [uncultured bacterium]
MNKILIIQLSRMGDIVQTLPLIFNLKKNYENVSIYFLGIENFYTLIKNFPLIDKFIPLDASLIDISFNPNTNDFSGLDKFISKSEALAEKYDLIINLTHNKFGSILCEKLTANKKSGRINSIADEQRLLGCFSKYLFSLTHNREENLFNLSDIYTGMGFIRFSKATNCIDVSESLENKALAILTNNGFNNKSKLIAFQPGANDLHRAWSVENFAMLAKKLTDSIDVQIVILGQNSELHLLNTFKSIFTNSFVNLIGKTTPEDLPSILKQCDLVISNDTGPIHIASAVGTKTLGLFFSTAYFGETAPYGENNFLIQSETVCSPCKAPCSNLACKEYISHEAVFQAVLQILNPEEQLIFNYKNINLYKSIFLKDNSLLYIPVNSIWSEKYITGFINRILWSHVLIPNFNDSELFSYIPEKSLNSFKIQTNKYQTLYSGIISIYDTVLNAYESFYSVNKATYSLSDLNLIGLRIRDAEENFSKLEEHIFKYFHTYELMDMDQLNFNETVVNVIQKYTKLKSVACKFMECLRKIMTVQNY